MKITQVIVRKSFENGGLVAVVSVIFDNEFALHDVKAVYLPDGSLGLVMPTDSAGRSVAHPLNNDYRGYMRDIIAKKLDTKSK